MKFILLLAFFTTTDGKQYLLQTTNYSGEYETAQACKSAAETVWTTFKKPLGKSNAVNLVAWCLAKETAQSSQNFRVDTVGQ
jgi:hypothetical protein